MALIPVKFRGVPELLAVVDDDLYEAAIECSWRWEHSGRGGWYVRGGNFRGLQYLHQFVLGIAPGRHAPRIDHVNGFTLDNRRSNLRIATTAQNAQNQGSRGGSSRYRGVTWDKSRQKWMATAMLDGRRRTIGRFDAEDEAHAAVVAWRREHMPFSEEAGLSACAASSSRQGRP